MILSGLHETLWQRIRQEKVSHITKAMTLWLPLNKEQNQAQLRKTVETMNKWKFCGAGVRTQGGLLNARQASTNRVTLPVHKCKSIYKWGGREGREYKGTAIQEAINGVLLKVCFLGWLMYRTYFIVQNQEKQVMLEEKKIPYH